MVTKDALKNQHTDLTRNVLYVFQLNVENTDHFLTECHYLPEKDRNYIHGLIPRPGKVDNDDEDEVQDYQSDDACVRSVDVPTVAR